MTVKATGLCQDCGAKLLVPSWARCTECDRKVPRLGRLYREVEPCPNCGNKDRKAFRQKYCNKKCKDEYKEKKNPHCVTKNCRNFVAKTGDKCAECMKLVVGQRMKYVFRRWRSGR